MQKIFFYTRNDASNHVIIKNIIAGFQKHYDVELLGFKDVFKWGRKLKSDRLNIVYHDDPIAMFVFFVFGFKSFRIFHSLEMYEYQVEVNNAKRAIRYLIFKALHKFALKTCDLIVFPNSLRRDFYLNKYSWLAKNKTKIIENIPVSLKRVSVDEIPEAKAIENFISKFKKSIVIAGAIGEGRDIEDVIRAFEKQNKYGLCIITQSEISLPTSESLLVYKNLPHEKVLSLYDFFDAGLLFYDNSPLNVKFCAPTKMYEYLSKGLYLIGNDNYSLRNNGYVDFFFEQPSDIFKALDRICELPPKESMAFDFYEAFDNAFKGLKNSL